MKRSESDQNEVFPTWFKYMWYGNMAWVGVAMTLYGGIELGFEVATAWKICDPEYLGVCAKVFGPYVLANITIMTGGGAAVYKGLTSLGGLVGKRGKGRSK